VIPDAYLEDLCFDAQQAAEKAIKAVCLHRGVSFPRIHDLTQLLTLLEQSGMKVPKYVWQAGRLTRFAVETRYPAFAKPVTKRQHQTMVRISAAVVRWADRTIN
jgi:HEPN domain-containing protein